KHFDLAFDTDTARAFHDEDLDVDTDFCAMCGHDWCSVRISKEIVEFESGKASGFERDRVVKSAALTPEQQEILRARGHLSPEELHRLAGKTKSAVGDTEKAACHSDVVRSESEALRVQGEKLLQLRRKGTQGAPRV
ncbi:MAG: phosphomethylpyrimidine synthase ThiC, partial [Deltaproteobacteria bacterium]|nr:phosphomethylpyrimidine synthase ThiC [Deltaproteobacteria bacterium]